MHNRTRCRRGVAAPTSGQLARDFVLHFVLQGYDPATNDLRIELHLKPVPVERLRALFDVGDDLRLCELSVGPATTSKSSSELCELV